MVNILQNSKMLIFVVIAAAALIFGSAGGSNTSVDVWKKSASLQDNTAKLDKAVNDYISGNGGLDDSVSEVINKLKNTSTSGNLTQDDVLTYNYTQDGLSVIITNPNNSTQSLTVDKNSFDRTIDNVIKLNSNEQVVNTWKNSAFDVNGFSKNFEALVVKDIAFDTYKVYYKIDTEKFIINDLNKVTKTEISNLEDFSKLTTSTYGNMYNDTNTYLVKYTDNTINLHNIISLVVIDNQEIKIMKEMVHDRQLSSSGFSYACQYTDVSYNYISNNKFDNPKSKCRIGQIYLATEKTQFAISEFEEYSKDSIAVNSNSRTAGFQKATLVKQELSTGFATATDKYIKLVSEEDFNSIQTENTQFFTPFLQDRIKNNIVSAGLNNILKVNTEPYTIGTTINGIVIDGGYSQNADLLNGTVQVVEQIKFNGADKIGLQFDDLGLVKLDGSQVEDLSFGNLQDNFALQTHGTAYMVDRTAWENALAVVWNVVTFDFSGVKQAWTNQAVNPTIEDDKTVGSVTGDTFGYTQSFKTAGNLNNLILTTAKPLTELLQYNGNNYWLFYTLEASTGENGCIVYDSLNSNLNVRIPVSTCGNTIAGTNSLSQFKIASD